MDRTARARRSAPRLEAIEARDFLRDVRRDRRFADVMTGCRERVAARRRRSGRCDPRRASCGARIGRAYERFVAMIEAQGGSRAGLEALEPAPIAGSVRAERTGVVARVDARALGDRGARFGRRARSRSRVSRAGARRRCGARAATCSLELFGAADGTAGRRGVHDRRCERRSGAARCSRRSTMPTDAGSSNAPSMMNGTPQRGRTIVTGAAGLIGSALVWQLNRDGVDDAIVVDRLGRSEKWKHLVPLQFAEYLEAEEFFRAHRRATRRVRPDRGGLSPRRVLGDDRTRCDLPDREQLPHDARPRALGARAERALRVRVVRGDVRCARNAVCAKTSTPHSLTPLNMYGYSKHLFDLWARREGILDRIVGLKFFNVYGPNEDHKGDMRSVVAKAYESDRGRRNR